MSMASWPLVRNRRFSGSPVSRDFTGSWMCSAGIHWRAPISACPVFSRTYDRWTVLMPFATWPAHPMYWRLTPAVASPAFSCPVSSIAPITSPPPAPSLLSSPPRGAPAGFSLPGLVDRPDPQPAPPLPAPRRLLQPGHREPAHYAHRGGGVPAHVVQQPLGLVRRLVPGVPGDAPPVALRQLPHPRGRVLARLQPRLWPGKTRPQQLQQLGPFPQRQPGAYPDGSSRLCSCTSHTGMITRRLRSRLPFL